MFGYNLISNKKILFLVLFVILCATVSVYGQDFDFKNNRFNKLILNHNGPIKNIYSSPKQVYLDSLILKKDQVQEFIKTPISSFIVTRGTGMVFKQARQFDSIWQFSKIDSTKFDGYNFDDIKFAYHDTLFSIGGFGFWRNNGQVRYFTENKEWELLMPEISYGISSRNYWNLDAINGLLYVIVSDKEDEFKLIKIDLSKKSWTAEKVPAVILSNILSTNETAMQIQLNNESGSILCYSNKTFYLNLSTGILKKASTDKLLNFANKNKIRDASYFEALNTLFVYNESIEVLDSIKLDKNEFTIIKENINYLNSNSLITVAITSILLIVVLIYRNRKKKISSSFEFNEFEKEFLNKLLNKKVKFIDIETLNYILGLSKKSPEIQKKNRSEFLNKLNHKLKEVFSTDNTIIIRVKDEEDKRVFVYQLNVEYFEKLEELL
jgi:hypothetical protein